MSSTSAPLSTPQGPGSVSGAPNLPAGFTDTFTSRYIDTGELCLHAVIGGDGPPLLLVHGWPETWYAWRLLMPELARDYQVIAVDQRGIGLSDKPQGGYDSGTLAGDLVALMDVLGHQRFAVVGHDTGFVIGYALAADHPDRVDRVALAEVPGSPGAAPSPPFFVPGPFNNKLWHIAVNRLDKVNEQLVEGREDIYFGYEFAIQAGKKLPDELVNYYVEILSNPDALRGTFGFYRAAAHARPGDRWSGKLRRTRRGRDEARRGRRAERGHSGLRALGRRGGSRGNAGRADRLPGPVPDWSSRMNAAQVSPQTGVKPTIVLVHGAFADAASWNGVIQQLQQQGCTVVAPANPLRGIADDAAYVAGQMAQTPGPVLAVGHSYGGAVITNAAARADNVVGLVYVAAFAPDEGETLGAIEAESKDSVLDTALVQRQYPTGQDGETAVEFAIDPAKFHDAFAADLPAEQTAVMAATQRPVAAAAFSEPNGTPAWKTLPSWAVVATGDKAAGSDVVRSMAQRAGADIVEVEGSHVIMISQPQAVTDVVLKAVHAVS
jgi:pimeloyl-ACP methyl ester carboxylesterase